MADWRDERAREDLRHRQNRDWDRRQDERASSRAAREAATRFRNNDLAGMASAMGMTDMAVSIAEGEYGRDPASSSDARESWDEAQRLFAEYKYFAARLQLDRILFHQPRNWRVLEFRGICRYHDRDYRGALEDYGAAARHGAPEADIRLHSGICRFRMGSIGEAIADLTRAIDERPNNDIAHYYRAHCHRRNGQLHAALEDASRAVELKPDFEPARRLKAECEAALDGR